MRLGIQDSLNIVAVKTLTQITPRLGFDYLQNFGFTTLVESKEINGQIFSDIQQSLALGGITDGVTNEELNASYATIANHGTYIKPKLYNTVVDHDGNIILDNTQSEAKQVIKETTAFLLTDAMVDVVTKGTGGSVNFGGMAIAGKTGTTSDYNDVWFAGFTPYYTATTWTGFDNNEKLAKGEERKLAQKLWRRHVADPCGTAKRTVFRPAWHRNGYRMLQIRQTADTRLMRYAEALLRRNILPMALCRQKVAMSITRSDLPV